MGRLKKINHSVTSPVLCLTVHVNVNHTLSLNTEMSGNHSDKGNDKGFSRSKVRPELHTSQQFMEKMFKCLQITFFVLLVSRV